MQYQINIRIIKTINFPLYDFDSVWVPNPHGQLQDSAATTGLINSIKSGSLDSLLTNPWLMSIFVATVILVVISAASTILYGQRSTEMNPSQKAYSELLQKSQNLDAVDSNFREYLTRNDYSSGLVSNPGLLQAVVLEASARYSNFVIARSLQSPKSCLQSA